MTDHTVSPADADTADLDLRGGLFDVIEGVLARCQVNGLEPEGELADVLTNWLTRRAASPADERLCEAAPATITAEQREAARENVAAALADDWNPDRDPVLTAMFRDYADTATTALLTDLGIGLLISLTLHENGDDE